MRVLVDTHAWLWMSLEPHRLSSAARELLTDGYNHLFLSSVSIWEVVLKCGTGKLRLPEPPERFVPARIHTFRMQEIPIASSHMLDVLRLPRHHRDPFDRLLITQAQAEGLPILTADTVFHRYDVEVIPAT